MAATAYEEEWYLINIGISTTRNSIPTVPPKWSHVPGSRRLFGAWHAVSDTQYLELGIWCWKFRVSH